MIRPIQGYIFLGALFLASTGYAIDVQVGEIKDSRTTGQFFSGLDVELKLIGDDLRDAKAMRTVVASALDSTGRDILKKDESSTDFQSLDHEYGLSNSVTLKLLNPSRKAESVKEIKGSVELFIPKNDPSASITLSGKKSFTGAALTSPVLKAAGISLAVFTADQMKAQQAKDKEVKVAELKKQGIGEDMIESAVSMMGLMDSSDPNALTIKLSDPKSMLVGMEVTKADGSKISSNGSMSSGDTKVLYFSEAIPEDAKFTVLVANPKAIMRVPIQVANVTLP